MLGCVLYSLCFSCHPFQDAQKLAIVNAHYFMPDDTRVSEKMKDFIRLMLIPNPEKRPTARIVLQLLENWSVITKIDLPEVALEIKQKQTGQQKTVSKPKDLTADDIFKLQEKIRSSN